MKKITWYCGVLLLLIPMVWGTTYTGPAVELVTNGKPGDSSLSKADCEAYGKSKPSGVNGWSDVVSPLDHESWGNYAEGCLLHTNNWVYYNEGTTNKECGVLDNNNKQSKCIIKVPNVQEIGSTTPATYPLDSISRAECEAYGKSVDKWVSIFNHNNIPKGCFIEGGGIYHNNLGDVACGHNSHNCLEKVEDESCDLNQNVLIDDNCVPKVEGCMDSTYETLGNYNADANSDDGSCDCTGANSERSGNACVCNSGRYLNGDVCEPWSTCDAGSKVITTFEKKTTTIFSSASAFAALKTDGSVKAWGDSGKGGCDGGTPSNVYHTCKPSDLTNVETIVSTNEAFAALTTDDTVVTWGSTSKGGDASGVTLTNVKEIFSTDYAFAALKHTGEVVAWGESNFGGDASGVTLTNVKEIFSTQRAFAALKHTGEVVAWGDADFGGDASGVQTDLTNVETIFSTSQAFAALKNDDTVVTWGSTSKGGDASGVTLTNVQTIFSTSSAFAALKTDGSVVAWGESSSGGDASGVTLTNVETIFSTSQAFAALKNDDTVVTWGSPDNGGDASSVTLTNVKEIFSTDYAFAALKKNTGEVVAWGADWSGGDASSVQTDLTNVQTIVSTSWAFAALKTDGSVVAWGNSNSGGTDPGISSGVVSIFSTTSTGGGAFAALKDTGEVVAWGSSGSGGTDPGIGPGEIVDVTPSSTQNRMCEACPVGEYQASDGFTGSTCDTCSAGSVTDTLTDTGATSCTPCVPGEYSSDSTTACNTCNAGSVTDTLTGTGATSCTPCDPGKYSSDSTTACADNVCTCPGGTPATGAACNHGTEQCTGCNAANHFVLDGNACVCDAANHFVPDGNGNCVCDSGNNFVLFFGYSCVCSSGRYLNGDECTTWSTCDAGYYQSTAPSSTVNRGCEACPVGEYQASNDFTGTSCNTCSAGSVTDTLTGTGATSCTPCDPGEYSSDSTTACDTCSAGSVTDTLTGTGATSCTPCPTGQWDDDDSSQTACVDWMSHTECQNKANHDNQLGQAYKPGTTTANAYCVKCDKGYVAPAALDNTDETSCDLLCSGGYGGNGTICTECPIDTYQVHKSLLNEPCADKYCPLGQGVTADTASSNSSHACEGCTGGTFSNSNQTGQCEVCDNHRFTADENDEYTDVNATQCLNCPAGKQQDEQGIFSGECDECDPNYISVAGGECSAKDTCPAGQGTVNHNPDDHVSQTVCEPCSGIQYNSANDYTACQDHAGCTPAQRFVHNPASASMCVDCGVGRVAKNGVYDTDCVCDSDNGWHAKDGACECRSDTHHLLSDNTCVPTACTCSNGVAALGAACGDGDTIDSEKCTSCTTANYVLSEGECKCQGDYFLYKGNCVLKVEGCMDSNYTILGNYDATANYDDGTKCQCATNANRCDICDDVCKCDAGYELQGGGDGGGDEVPIANPKPTPTRRRLTAGTCQPVASCTDPLANNYVGVPDVPWRDNEAVCQYTVTSTNFDFGDTGVTTTDWAALDFTTAKGKRIKSKKTTVVGKREDRKMIIRDMFRKPGATRQFKMPFSQIDRAGTFKRIYGDNITLNVQQPRNVPSGQSVDDLPEDTLDAFGPNDPFYVPLVAGEGVKLEVNGIIIKLYQSDENTLQVTIGTVQCVISEANPTCVAEAGGTHYSITYGSGTGEEAIGGCMDNHTSISNYDPLAQYDDGSCAGCTNSTFLNYYAGADVDDGSCMGIPGPACLDPHLNTDGFLAGVTWNDTTKTLTINDGPTVIADNAYKDCTDIEAVVIPDSVETIGVEAFNGASNLTSVNIPSSVTEIGAAAFKYSGLTSVTLPDSVIEIGSQAFQSAANLISVNIPSSVTEIGVAAFRNTGLTSVTIPSSVTEIKYQAFAGTDMISVTIPSSVTTIDDKAFEFSALTSITVLSPSTTFGSKAFYSTSLNQFCGSEIGGRANVPTIDQSAQTPCVAGIAPVCLGGTWRVASTPITGATWDDATKTLTINDGTTVIADNAYKDCTDIEAVVIPDSVTHTGRWAFMGNTVLASVTLGANVQEIGHGAFENTALTSVTLPDSLQTIGGGAFFRTDLTSIIIPDSVTDIGSNAFNDVQDLNSVTLGNNVQTIGIGAFQKTYHLTSIEIPASVQTIGNSAFERSGLTSITVLSPSTTFGSDAFDSTSLNQFCGSEIGGRANVPTIDQSTQLPCHAACDDDSHALPWELTCEVTGCVCEHGTAHSGNTCPTNTEGCKTCADGSFVNENGVCKCPSGSHLTGGTCETNVYNPIVQEDDLGTVDDSAWAAVAANCAANEYVHNTGTALECRTCSQATFKSAYTVDNLVDVDTQSTYRHYKCCSYPSQKVCAKMLSEYQTRCVTDDSCPQ